MGAAADVADNTDPMYAPTLAAQYNQLEPENAMKFAEIHPNAGTDPSAYDFTNADKLVTFAQQNSMKIRGHNFVWYQDLPAWLTNGVTAGTYGPTDLNTILQNHITTVATHFAGQVWAWDVVNEAFNADGSMHTSIWYDSPGIGFSGQGTKYIEQAFDWAHAADPNAKLFYNDFGAEMENAKSDAILAMFNDFKSRGVPIDGIGFEMHVKLQFDDPTVLSSFTANLQRFAAAGAEIHITEMDVALTSDDSTSLATQADIYKKVMQTCLQIPKCTVFQTWGFTDKFSWIPASTNGTEGWALPFDANYNPKPAFDALIQALQGQ